MASAVKAGLLVAFMLTICSFSVIEGSRGSCPAVQLPLPFFCDFPGGSSDPVRCYSDNNCDVSGGEGCCRNVCNKKTCIFIPDDRCPTKVTNPLPDFCAFTDFLPSTCFTDTVCEGEKSGDICCPNACGITNCITPSKH